MIDLGTLGTLGGEDSHASAISDAGIVVGYSEIGGFIGQRELAHAFAEADGQMLDLGTLDGGFVSVATDINESGEVVGSSGHNSVIGDEDHAVYWRVSLDATSNLTTTSPQDLGTLGGLKSSAQSINNNREIVGRSETADGVGHAVYWKVDADGNVQTMTDLGSDSLANSINDAGEVTGVFVTSDGEVHAVFWRLDADGNVTSRTDLGKLNDTDAGSQAFDINSAGEITGGSWYTKRKSTGRFHRAVVWDLATESIVEILKESSGGGFGDLWFGNAINNNGLIVGEGVTSGRRGGSIRGFIAVPLQ